jgi:hypothetical protein
MRKSLLLILPMCLVVTSIKGISHVFFCRPDESLSRAIA